MNQPPDMPDVPPGHHTHTAQALDPTEAFTEINNRVVHLLESMRNDPTGLSAEDAAIALVTAAEAMQFVSQFAVSNLMGAAATLIPPDVIERALDASVQARAARSAEEQNRHTVDLIEPYMHEVLIVVPDHHDPGPTPDSPT